MNGGHFAKFKQAFKLRMVFGAIIFGLIVALFTYYIVENFIFEPVIIICFIAVFTIVFGAMFSLIMSDILIKPTEYITQAIFHVSPNEHLVGAPNIESLGFGKDLVEQLARQIYDYASINNAVPTTQSTGIDSVLDQVPVGIFGLGPDGTIKVANKTAIDVFELNSPIDTPFLSQLHSDSFNKTMSDWLNQAKNQSINSSNIWRKIDITSGINNKRSYYDVAAIYRQGHSSGIELLLALFNHDDVYRAEEDALSLVALSVHEIRTPLTIVRGYVDVLKEELEGKLDDQEKVSLSRLSASAQNLATFMSNVLNVVKADQNQLSLPLKEESWADSLSLIVNNLKERANVRGKELNLNISADLPAVALNKVSINEVLTNLIDNSIKYSPASKTNIYIEANTDTDGMILTTVRDEGVGIPDSVVPSLFTKFQRNHRNSKSVTGTGLGLFLSKAIVSAHHGNIWIKSKEGEGTTVGFTLLPYSKLADYAKDSDNGSSKVIHGWIKNHGMQRR